VDQAVDDAGANNYYLGGIVRGEADKFHLTYKFEGPTLESEHKSVQDVDGTLSSAESMGAPGGENFSSLPSVYYDDEGEEIITGMVRSTTVGSVEIVDDGSPGSKRNITGPTPPEATGAFTIWSIAVDVKTVWLIYADSTFDVFSESTVDRASWSNSVEELDAITCNLITSEVYHRASTIFLGWMYDDGGTIKYAERVIRYEMRVEAGSYAHTGQDAGTFHIPQFKDAQLPLVNSWIGPFRFDSGYYAILHEPGDRKRLLMFKSADPATTPFAWISTSGGIELLPEDQASVWAVGNVNASLQAGEGTLIHVATASERDGGGDSIIRYHQFNTVTDQWDVINEVVDAEATVATDDLAAVSIVVQRSQTLQDVIVVYNKDNGTDPEVWWAIRDGDTPGVWTPALLKAPAASGAVYIGAAVLGNDDRVHVLMVEDAAPDVLHLATIRQNETINLQNIAGTPHAVHAAGMRAIAYPKGTVVKVRMAYAESAAEGGLIGVVKFDSADTPSTAIDADVSDFIPLRPAATLTPIGNLVNFGEILHLLYVEEVAQGQDLRRDQNIDDGGWGTDVEEIVSTIDAISCNFYANDKPSVAVIYQINGGDLTYAEIEFEDTFPNSQLPKQNFFIGPFKAP